jgi:hypothetical protein
VVYRIASAGHLLIEHDEYSYPRPCIKQVQRIGIQKMREKILTFIAVLGVHRSGSVLDNDDFCFFPI